VKKGKTELILFFLFKKSRRGQQKFSRRCKDDEKKLKGQAETLKGGDRNIIPFEVRKGGNRRWGKE